MKTIFLILNWGFGGLLLLMGLWTISSTPFNMISVNLGGLCLLAIAFLLLPPVRKFLEGKTGKSLSIKSRAVTIFILLIVAVFGIHDIEEQIRSHEVAQTERDNIDYFKSNRAEIIAAMNESIDSGQFQDAIYHASRYLVAEDEELNGLYAQANKRLTEEQERKEAQEKKEAEEKRLAEKAAEEARLIAEKAAERERKRNILNDAELLHEEYFGAAEWDCAKAVERRANWDFEWLDGVFSFKFDRYETTVETPGVLVVLGDKVKFQNGFGAWTRMNYSCHYDGPNERVLSVDVW